MHFFSFLFVCIEWIIKKNHTPKFVVDLHYMCIHTVYSPLIIHITLETVVTVVTTFSSYHNIVGNYYFLHTCEIHIV